MELRVNRMVKNHFIEMRINDSKIEIRLVLVYFRFKIGIMKFY